MSDKEYDLYHPLVLAIAEGAVTTVVGWDSCQGQIQSQLARVLVMLNSDTASIHQGSTATKMLGAVGRGYYPGTHSSCMSQIGSSTVLSLIYYTVPLIRLF